jgi:hypothetical protein
LPGYPGANSQRFGLVANAMLWQLLHTAHGGTSGRDDYLTQIIKRWRVICALVMSEPG